MLGVLGILGVLGVLWVVVPAGGPFPAGGAHVGEDLRVECAQLVQGP